MKVGETIRGADMVNDIPQMLPDESRTIGEITSEVKLDMIKSVEEIQSEKENNARHIKELVTQAEAMDRQEQEATARGLSSDVMLEEIARRARVADVALKGIREVMQNAEY